MKHAYEVVPGLFTLTERPHARANPIQIPPRFGLVDASPAGWENLRRTFSNLNSSAPKDTSYRLIFIGRHGQGFHNVAESLYGTMEWRRTKAKENGDGNIIWGPDPKLTELGIQQAHVAHGEWVTEMARGIPLPESLYSSPFTRAIHTALITFNGILIDSPDASRIQRRPVIKEKLREINGVHTCDKRSPRSRIAEEFPQFDFEPGFIEEDRLWRPDHRETEDELTTRLREAFDEIFSEDSATFISITAHGGASRGMMRVVGLTPFELPTGGVVAIPVKVTQQTDGI